MASPYRILLADDDPAVQRAVERVAKELGYEVFHATRGTAVHARTLELKPDLLVLDLGFPDAEGRDLLAKLKADPGTAEVPVLVWSGRHDLETERRIALSLGAEDYVEKTDAELLMRKIERLRLRIKGSE